MIHNNPARRLAVASLLFLFVFTSIASAIPRQKNPFIQDEQKEIVKLPPVNWIRSRTIDVKHIAIDLRFDWDKSQAYGTSTVTLSPFRDTDRIYLDAAMMTINSVKLDSGADLKFDYDGKKDGDNLAITLPRVYKDGENVTVKVDYRTNYVNTADADTAIGSFGKGLRFIKPTDDDPKKPRQIWSQGETEFNRYWFPSYDTPNDFRTTELRATVEKPFTVVSNGKLIETKENPDNTRTFYWKMDTPYTNYLTSIVVGEYKEVVQNYDGIPVINYGYPDQSREVAATVKNLPDNIKFFSDVTGIKYPYDKYAQTFVEDFGGGMENISATTMIEEMIHDERELLDEDSDSLQAHELAHQWFGDYVTCRDWGQIWLNESFATYFDALYNEHNQGHDEFLYTRVRANQNEYYSTWENGNRRPIVTKYYSNKDSMFDSYAYPRGAAVLHMLRKHLGDKAFYKAMNHYLVSNAHQPVSTEDLRIAIEESTGESMDWFFDQWLYRMGHPVFEVTKSYDAAAKKVTLNVKQTQTIDLLNEFPQVAFFQSNVEIEVDGRVEKRWIEPKELNVFTFDSATEPKLVNFDYEGTLIKEVTFAKTTDELIYQMQNDKDLLGRLWAREQLEEKMEGSPDAHRIMLAILGAAEKDPFWRNRLAALESIRTNLVPPSPPGMEIPAQAIDQATTQVLIKAAKDPKSGLRSEAVYFLGLSKDAKHADIYLAALNDPSYSVIDSAVFALARTKNAKAYDAFVKLTKTPSWKGRLQTAGLNGLAGLGDKRAFDLAYKLATDKTASSALRNSAMEVVGATGRGDARAYPLIFEKFKAGLDVGNEGILLSTVQAIIKLGDPRGQEAFDMLKVKYKDNADIMILIGLFERQFKESLEKK